MAMGEAKIASFVRRGAIALAILFVSVACRDEGSKPLGAGRENRLAGKLGIKELRLSPQEQAAGLDYVRLSMKVVSMMPPIINKVAGDTSTAKNVEADFSKAHAKELLPVLAPLGAGGDAGRLRQAVNLAFESVRYCYSEDVRQARRSPSDAQPLLLLRMDTPPLSTQEAVKGILQVYNDLVELCDPTLSKRFEAEARSN